MNPSQPFGSPSSSAPRSIETNEGIEDALLKLFSFDRSTVQPESPVMQQVIQPFCNAATIDRFELGDVLGDYANPQSSVNSAHAKQNDANTVRTHERTQTSQTSSLNTLNHAPQSELGDSLYLICEGRVRLLCSRSGREVSAIVLQAGDFFGTEAQFCALPCHYRIVAASSGAIVRIPLALLHDWIETVPQLHNVLQQRIQQRECLLSFRSGLMSAELNSDQIQRLLSFIEVICVPAEKALHELLSGYCWLRDGLICDRSTESESSVPSLGSCWQTTPASWIAQSDSVIYQIPVMHWDAARSIAPSLFASVSGERSVMIPRTAVPLRRPGRSLKVVSSNLPPAVSEKRDRSETPDPVVFPKPKRMRQFWRGYPFIEQQSSSDCGVACLAMISQYWGVRFAINSLRDLAKVGRSGATLKHLASAAETIGYQARPVRASINRLADQKQPWIAHWQGEHYVVVYQVERDRVFVADPARGKQYMPRSTFLASWTGYALLLDPTDRLQAREEDQASLSRFWRLLWQYRTTLGQIILLSLLIQLFGLITPLFTQVILDKVVVQKSLPTLNVFALGLVLFSVWRIGLTTVRQYLLDYFSNRLNLTLVSGFISHALLLPLQFFEQRQVGDIITRVQENNKVQTFLVRQAVSTWLDSTMAIVYLGLMFYYNVRLALLVVALIPPIVILTLVATPFLRKISREVFTEAAEQNSLLVEMMSGIATVKSAAAERDIRWRWEDRLTSLLNVQFKGQKLANGLQAVGGLINAIGSAALLWYGASLVIQNQLTIGQFVAFNMLIGNVISPVLSLVGLWDEFQEVLISVERLNDIFSAKPEASIDQSALVLPPLRGEICFENVTFRYDAAEERNTLQNLSFTAEAGQTIAIVGRSGSGKSTLVKLLQGLYAPVSGRLLIDGHDITHVSPQSLRSQLGVVPQECFLFSGTIAENICIYRPEFTLSQVVEVAKLAEAHSFIQDLPLGYTTKVGERGANLSGGQRQRIAIARALLGAPAILVLDEATSSLDTESERRFQTNLARISRGRTTFIIAHRLSTVRHADRILVLDQGILLEQGTHDELIAQNGLYRHLAQQQLDL